MKSSKKFGLVVCGITSAFVSNVVITSICIPKTQAANINLVRNGSFEEDSLVNPNDPTRANPYITGWTNSTANDVFYTIYLDNYPNTGNLSVNLAGSGDFRYLSQTLNTKKNKEYKLSFYLASAEEAPRLGNEFEVFVGGKSIFDQTNISYQPFTRYDFNFVTTSKSTELKFASKVGYDWLNLDDVSIFRVKNNQHEDEQRFNIASIEPVPEASNIGGMAIAGLLGMWVKRKWLASNLKVDD